MDFRRGWAIAASGILLACGDDGSGSGGAGGATAAQTTGGPETAATGATTSSGTQAATGTGGAAGLDLDGDGLDDAQEAALAASYRPFLSVDPDDGCALSGIVYRVRPHPTAAGMIHILYDHLFENDCGLNGHVGDNEAFGVTIDPAVAPPAGILSIVAISHQGTFCENVSACGTCGGLDACDTGADGFPVVYSSRDKHGGYTNVCSSINCFDSCTLAAASANPPMVNVGEPGAPLVTNLTAQGFITAANGWTAEELFDFDPWDPSTDFGSAGNVAGDLVDDAFIPSCP